MILLPNILLGRPDSSKADNMTSTNTSTPGAGERRAIGGYQGQYRYAASLILPRLRDGTLTWIKLADPDAGRLDDLQLCTSVRVDAFQVKWSRFPSTFSFRNLTEPHADGPSLIEQLVDGWRRISVANPGHRVVVHLVTNDFPSQNDTVPGASSSPKHFAAFLADCWPRPEKTGVSSNFSIAEKWRAAWQALAKAAGLDLAAFFLFVADCRLDFGSRRPDESTGTDADTAPHVARERMLRLADLDALNLALYQIVASPTQIVTLSRERLLTVLGWRDRSEFRSLHEFPEPSIPYHAIRNSVEELEQALGRNAGGYVLLMGTPGSGKSTLLTRTMRYRPDRVIRYYAYTPDALEPNNHRGEAVNFLHDLCLSLDRLGFPVGEALPKDDLRLLRSRLSEQLRRLGEDYSTTGRRTLIVVDGLDHIVREQSPDRSLLNDLPLPAQLPKGVFLILGSQTDELSELPPAVRSQIREAPRRVIMLRLPRSAAVTIVTETLELSEGADIDRIVELSGGHPLALAYIINGLRQRSSEPASAVLDTIAPFRERIDEQYESQFIAIENDHGLIRLLALLARVRGAIDSSWVERWAEAEVLYRLRRFDYYFRHESDGRRYFFHNSFRAFLLERTRTLPGVGSTEGDAPLYHQLAECCAAEPVASPHRWDELYYRAHACEDAKVLELAEASALREQFYSGRDLDDIDADLRLAIRSAGARKDIGAFARLVLAGKEFQVRANNLEEVPIVELLLTQRETRLAADHVRDGHRLRISPLQALEVCVAFAAADLGDEARRIFDLAEPLEVLNKPSAPEGQERQNADELLMAWAVAAPRFRPVSQLMHVVTRLRREGDEIKRRTADQTTKELHAGLRFRLALSCSAMGRWTEADSLVSGYRPADATDWSWWYWWHAHSWRYAWEFGDHERARSLVSTASSVASAIPLGLSESIVLAEGLYRVSGDVVKARNIVSPLPQPSTVGSTRIYSQQDFTPFEDLFRLNRILAALGITRPLSELIPDALTEEDESLVFFERLVIYVARLHGQAWRGNLLPSGSFAREAAPVIRFFSQAAPRARDSFYRAQEGRIGLYERLINAAALHDPSAVEEVQQAFEAEWSATEIQPFWPAEVVRKVTLALYEVGADRDWCMKRITSLDQRPLEAMGPDTRLEDATAQARAYFTVGDRDRGKGAYRALLTRSLLVGHKDDQLVSWVAWAERASKEDPERGPARFGRLAGYLPAVRESDEVLSYTAQQLLQSVCRWDRAAGVALLEWYYSQGILPFTNSLETLLEQLAQAPELYELVSGIYRHLLLPLQRSPSKPLVLALAQTLRQRSAALEIQFPAEATLLVLWKSIAVYASPSTRATLYEIVKGEAASLGIKDFPTLSASDTAAAQRDRSSGTPDESRATDAFGPPELSMREVRRRASTVDGMLQLLDRQRPGTWFRWEPILEALVSNATYEEAIRIGRAFHEKPHNDFRPWQVDLLLSRRLCELKRNVDAWGLAERAFNEAPNYGWRQRHDGGSCIQTLEALHAIDVPRSQDVGLLRLVQDLANDTLDPGTIATELHRILPLLTNSVSAKVVWDYVNGYLEVLFAYATPVQPPMLPLPGTTSGGLALAHLTVRLIGHATYFVDHGAQRLAIERLLDGDANVQLAFVERLADSGAPHDALLTVLEAVNSRRPEALLPVRGAVLTALHSPHQNVRWRARRILASTRLEAPRNSSNQSPLQEPAPARELPQIYRLAFPRLRPSSRIGDLPDGVPLPATDNPTEIVRLFVPELDAIARAAGVQLAALSARVIQIMARLDPASLTDGEVQLRNTLDGVGLNLTYRRPRARAVRAAMNHALAELIDAGRVESERQRTLEQLLRSSDPTALLIRPTTRPDCICRLSPSEQGDYHFERWVRTSDTSTSACLMPALSDGGIVLAEETTLKELSWEIPTERRCGVRVVGWPPENILREEDDPMAVLCEKWRHVLISEYLEYECETDLLVVVQTGERFDTPCKRWLAFNPEVARQMDWIPSSTGLFRWVDNQGRMMVESIWWQDGFPEQRPPQHDEEVGEGWLIILSERGAAAIRDEFGALTACVRVEREAKDQTPMRATRQDMPEYSGP